MVSRCFSWLSLGLCCLNLNTPVESCFCLRKVLCTCFWILLGLLWNGPFKFYAVSFDSVCFKRAVQECFDLLCCCVGVMLGRFDCFFGLPLASQVSRLNCLRLLRVVLSCVNFGLSCFPLFRILLFTRFSHVFSSSFSFYVLVYCCKGFFCSPSCIRFFFPETLCKIVVISLVCFRMFFDIGGCFSLALGSSRLFRFVPGGFRLMWDVLGCF